MEVLANGKDVRSYKRGLVGERALIAAVIAAAAEDLGSPKYSADAAAYFQSELYRHHLESIGLAPDLMPILHKA